LLCHSWLIRKRNGWGSGKRGGVGDKGGDREERRKEKLWYLCKINKIFLIAKKSM
jgi:ribosomal protein L15